MKRRDEVKSFWIKAGGRCREIAYRGNTTEWIGLGSRRKVIENEAERGSPRCLDVSIICHAEESSLHHLIGSIKCILNFRKEIE